MTTAVTDSKTPLPLSKNFRGLFWTQFFGALNDNVFKNALVVSIAFSEERIFGLNPASIVALAGGLFILPFFLFSGLSGRLSDKVDKSKIARLVKWVELTIMSLAIIGFMYHLYGLLLFLLMMMGMHSTFFGPMKYSIIPELVAPEELASANGWVESATYVSILLGTILGGVAVSSEHEMLWLAFLFWGVSIAGLLTSYLIPHVRANRPELEIGYNIFSDIADSWRKARQHTVVFQSVLGISWFWLFGSVLLSVLPVYVRQHINGNEGVFIAFLSIFTLGIGFGSFVVVILSKKIPPIVFVPVGILGVSAALVDWSWVTQAWPAHAEGSVPLSFELLLMQNGSWRMIVDLFLIATMGGVYTLPLYTWMQQFSQAGERSRVVAANNILNAAFMVVGSLGLMLLYHFQFNFVQIFLLVAALNFLWAVAYHFTLRPLFLARPLPKVD